jgi:hypothetical protein
MELAGADDKDGKPDSGELREKANQTPLQFFTAPATLANSR